MNTKNGNLILLCFAFVLAGATGKTYAQGSLTPPPGTPVPSMRTLAQVEPRTPISELPFTISAPGSYYLTANLAVGAESDGIAVQASNVTIDLGGFTLSGPGDDSGRGIYQSADCNSLRVLNGTVTGFWGSSAGGLCLEGANNQVDGIRAIDNFYGIYCENMTRITSCTAYANYGDGIYLRRGTLSDCAANGNQGHGINGESFAASDCAASENSGFGFNLSGSASLKGCVAKANQSGGISASSDSVLTACVADRNFANGIELFDGANVSGCTVSNNRNNGIVAQSKSTIAENVCRFNGQRDDGAGIYVTGFGNRIEKNHVTGTARGLQITGTDNVVSGNTVLDNADNYVFAAGNRLNLLLCEVPEVIEWPCSVTLAGTLTCLQTGVSGITVGADNVAIDLAGNALVGPGASSGHGVYQSAAYKNLSVRNGTISDWRGTTLVQGQLPAALASFGSRTSVENVKADNCSMGINASGSGSMLAKCQASDNLFYGLSVGADGALADCVSVDNGQYGIFAGSRARIERCTARDNGNDGIRADDGSTVLECESVGNKNDGVDVSNSACVERNTCRQNGNQGDGAGIHANSGCRIVGNRSIENDRGLDLDNGLNTVEANEVAGNTDNYDFIGGNRLNLLISDVPENLEWPCNAKLAGSLSLSVANTNAITILSSDVTFDLGGHTLQGTTLTPAGIAILSPAVENVHIFNGAIRGFNDFGIDALNVCNSRVEKLTISYIRHYLNSAGIRMRAEGGECSGNIIRDCLIDEAAEGVLLYAVSSPLEDIRISDCAIRNVGYAVSVHGYGHAARLIVIEGCSIHAHSLGLYLDMVEHSTIRRCTIGADRGAMVLSYCWSCRVEENHMSATDEDGPGIYGIQSGGGAANTFVRNTCFDFEEGNYDLDPNDTYGPIIQWAGELSGADPWANFSR